MLVTDGSHPSALALGVYVHVAPPSLEKSKLSDALFNPLYVYVSELVGEPFENVTGPEPLPLMSSTYIAVLAGIPSTMLIELSSTVPEPWFVRRIV
jgi:hypothetical protein